MLNLKRKHVWCAIVAGFFAILIFTVTVVVPFYLNLAAVKNRIQAAVQEKLSGKVSYDKIDISLFPRPRVTIEGLSLAYPHTFRGTLRSLSIAPQILPLFRGRLQVSKIRIQEPDFRIAVPAAKTDTTSEAPTLEETRDDIRSVLGYLHMIGPRLVVEMDNGKFLLRKNHRDFLSLKNVTAHFNAPPGDMHFLVMSGTDRWGDFTLSGTYSFTEAQTEIRDLTLALGHSSLTDFSALLTWDRDPRIEIRSGRAEFALQEIYEWLKSSENLTPFMKELSSLKGTLVITSMKGQGLLSQPEKLRMRLTGEARRIEFTSPKLPAPVMVNYSFAVEDNLVDITEFSARMGSSSLSHVSALLTGRDDPVLELRSGNATININEGFGWRRWHPALAHILQEVDTLAGKFTLTALKINGRLYRPLTWKVIAAGEFDHILFHAPDLPGPLGLVKGTFSYVPDKLDFGLKEATILDSTITGTAVVSGITTTVSTVDVTLDGSSGRKTVDWAFENLQLPPELMVKTPLALSGAHLVWKRNRGTSFSGTASVAGGLKFFVDIFQQGGDLEVRKFSINDQETKAAFTLNWQKQAADFSFSGLLAESTLSRLFEHGTFGSGTMRGDFHSLVRTDLPLKSRARGSLTGSDLFVPWGMPVPTTVNKFALRAKDDVLTVESADVTWGKNHYSLTGAVTTSNEGLAFSMKLAADGIDIDTIQQALAQSSGKQAASADQAQPQLTPEQKARSFPLPPIRGDFTANSAYVKYGRFTLAPAHAVMTVEPGTVGLAFDSTKTCGVTLAGAVLVSRESTSFTFTPSAKALPLEPTIDCLAGKELHITGAYDLTAKIQSHGTGADMLSALEGRVDFKASKGMIYHFPTLANVLSVLSVFEIFRGRAPEIGGNGFPYNSMALRGDIHQGVFSIEKAYIGGKSLDLIAEGEVDLVQQKIDMIVLVAPFSSINWLIRHTPVVNTVMGGTLISIPTRVSGDLRNPEVTVLSPEAVGSRILEMFMNDIKAPVELFSKEKEKK
jgi:AsmA-like C-terminal region/AsmA family